MLSNAYFLAKFRFDTAENEPAKNLQNFRKMHFRKMHFQKMHLLKIIQVPAQIRDQQPPGSDANAARRVRRIAGHQGGGLKGPGPLRSQSASVGDLVKFRQNVARFRLYRHRFLQVNMRFAAFFKIYQILKLTFLKFDKILQILQILRHLQFFC